MSIYIAYCRETSTTLNASVRCKQKRLQRLSETVPANNRIPQAVWQEIPDRPTSYTESPSVIGAESVVRYDSGKTSKLSTLTVVQSSAQFIYIDLRSRIPYSTSTQ